MQCQMKQQFLHVSHSCIANDIASPKKLLTLHMDIISSNQKNTHLVIWMLDQVMKKITNLAYECISNKYGLKIYRHCHQWQTHASPTTIICQWKGPSLSTTNNTQSQNLIIKLMQILNQKKKKHHNIIGLTFTT